MPGTSSMLGISSVYDDALQRKCLYCFATGPGFSGLNFPTNAFPWPTHFALSIERPELTVACASSKRSMYDPYVWLRRAYSGFCVLS